MAKRKFGKLKALLYEQEITQNDIAQLLGRGRGYVSARLNGRASFTLAEASKLAHLLDIPEEKWAEYFAEGL